MRKIARRTAALLAAATILAAGAGCGGKATQKASEPMFIPRPKEVVPPPPPPASAPEAEEMTRQGSVKLEYPEPGFRGAPVRFTWYRFPEAASYQVMVMTATETVLFESPPGAENLFDSPAEWTEALEDGSIYFWQVTALGEAGTPIGRSSLRDFMYRP